MKLTEKNILKTLLSCKEPISAKNLANKMGCDPDSLSYYLNSFVQRGFVSETQRPFEESLRYSPLRFELLYKALPTANAYIYSLKQNHLTLVFTVLAAITGTLSLIATIIIPFLG